MIQKTTSINYAYFFPDVLQNKTKVEKVSDIKRSLYNPIVFKADMTFNGSFENLNFDKLGIKKENVVWDKASVIIKTTNLKSIKSDLKINVNGSNYSMESKTDGGDNVFGTLETSTFNITDVSRDGESGLTLAMTSTPEQTRQFINE